MDAGLVTGLYLVAAVLFVKSLGSLSTQATAPRGNLLGVVGMALAVVVTAAGSAAGTPSVEGLGVLLAILVADGAIGALVAQRVAMTSMPELVAILHSFVGLGAVLVGFAGYLGAQHHPEGAARVVHLVEVFLGVLVGAVTFTGSIVAFGKLRGTVTGKPLLLPGRHALNLSLIHI